MFPEQVLEDIQAGKQYLSTLNADYIADIKKGCSDCSPKDYNCLSRLLKSLIDLSDVGDYTDVAEALYYQLLGIIGGGGVVKQTQTITFPALPSGKQVGDADFSPGATASSGLAVSYVSSNTSVATIVGGLIHIVGVGSTNITASQAGNDTYYAATPVVRALTIANNATVNFGFTNVNPFGNVTGVSLPSSLVISSGVSQYTINFTSGANLQYLVHREPIGEPIKTVWINNIDFNLGVIPDSKYQSYLESGGFRYYYTRVLFPFYSGTYTIQFKTS